MVLEQLDADEARQEPKDDTWATTTDLTHLTSSFWEDPEPDTEALLTADRIRRYHYEVGRMIRPFQERHLNAASYDLTIGPRCLIDGEPRILSQREPAFEIPPNSIAFVSSREMLLVPHWLVARFNLKRNLIFRGLLMGVGPQIDPGFIGVLAAPLHNISSNPVELSFLEPFAKVDFVKTTWGQSVHPVGIATEEELYRRYTERRLRAVDGEAVKLWPNDQNLRQPFQGRPAKRVKSSVREIDERVKRFEGELTDRVDLVERDTDAQIRRANLINLATAVAVLLAFAGAAVGIIVFTHSYTDSKVEDGLKASNARKAASDIRNDLRDLRSKLPAKYGGTK